MGPVRPGSSSISRFVRPGTGVGGRAPMHGLHSGTESYTELGEITEYAGGHLLYHLNKLTDAGLV